MKKMFWFVIVMLCMAFTWSITSCDNEDHKVETMSEVNHIIKGYEVIPSLAHNPDSSQKTKYEDVMDSRLTIYATQNGERMEPAVYDNTVHPKLTIGSILAKQDYAIPEELLNCQPSSSNVLRGQKVEKDGTITELDTVIYNYPDQQVWTIPVEVKNEKVKVGSTEFDFPSLTFVGHEWQYRHDMKVAKTRGQYMSGDYTSEHKSILSFKETNIENPRLIKAPIYAFTRVFTMKDDKLVKVEADTTRTWVDETTEKVTVDLTEIYESEITINQSFDFICKHLFKGDEPYSKEVNNWNHTHTSHRAIAWGAERKLEGRGDSLWTVYGKDGKNYEIYENGISEDKVDCGFNYYIERPVFRKEYADTTIVIDFGYADVKVEELSNSITSVDSDKENMNKAVLKSFESTNYLGGGQTLCDVVNLYMSNEDIKDEALNGKIWVTTDSVCADITNKQTLANGKVREIKDHWSQPWTIKNTTDWASIQEVMSQMTEDVVAVALSGKEAKNKGNWYWDDLTNTLSDYTTLYNGEKMLNGRVSKFANNLKYKTPSGKVYTFEVLEYKVKEIGAQLNLKGEEDGFTEYDFTDVIEENLGGYARNNTAHGLLKVTSEKIIKKEARNKVQTISDDKVHNEFDRVIVFSSHEDVEHMTHDFPRSTSNGPAWSATEKDGTEKTAQPSAKLNSSEVVEDGAWSCDMQTRGISALVTLSTSTQSNEWTSKDPNHIKYVEDGLVVEFDEIKFSVAYVNSSSSLAGTEGLTETYSYNNTISETYGDNSKSLSFPGTITVTKGKEVVDHDMRDKVYVITNDDVTAVGKYYNIYNDGTEDYEEVKKTVARIRNPYTNWNVNDVNMSVLTGSVVTKLLSSDAKSDGFWGWNAEKRDNTTEAQLTSSTQKNGVETIDPNLFTYERDGKTYEWGEINFSAIEDGQDVKLASETATLSTYDYTDKITITFGENVQSVTLPGKINVAREKTVTNKYLTDDNQVIEKGGVTSSIKLITEWSDGTVDEQSFSKFVARNFRRISDWASEEENANQSTGSASVSVVSEDSQSEDNWSWVNRKRSITTSTTLNASTQTNEWESIDPDAFVFEIDGLTHNFGTISFSAQETGSNVTKKDENDDETTYDFTDNISVSYGSNSFDSSAPGLITVAKPWNPDFNHGKFTGCVFTTARNEGRDTWVYIASVHFEKGTLPLVIRRGANTPEVNDAYFEAITDSRLNSGTWIPAWGKWINTIADDTPDLLQWDTVEGANADNLLYRTATAWGWDDGYTVNGHPSVFTDKFSSSISSDGYVLTIYKGDKVFATYKAAKK